MKQCCAVLIWMVVHASALVLNVYSVVALVMVDSDFFDAETGSLMPCPFGDVAGVVGYHWRLPFILVRRFYRCEDAEAHLDLFL
jgi:hypothetical protein